MFFGLSFFLETWLKLSLFGGNDKNCNICLASAHYHIWHIVFVARSIKKSESFVFQWKVEFGKLPSFSINLFFRNNVWNTCLFPSLHLIWLRVLFDPQKLLLINFLQFLHDVTCECGFAWVYVANKHNIYVLLSQKACAKVLWRIPVSAEKFLNINLRIPRPNYNFFLFFDLFYWFWLLLLFGRIRILVFLFVLLKIVSHLFLL